jgi:regulatory protein
VTQSNRPEKIRYPVDDDKACRRRALDLLARREHSRLELERKLLDRGFAEEIVDEVLNSLQADNLLDESRFLESFIRTRVGKGQGPARIEADLSQRGIDSGRVRAWLRDAELNWPSLAARVREKRFGPGRPRSFEERSRQAKFLQYRGFDSEQINTALELAGESD